MYTFHYQEIMSKYESRAKLAYTDTYSFIYHIQTRDLYKDMADKLDAYDTSDYPVDHPIHSKTNAKVLGKMKDEYSSYGIEIYCERSFTSVHPQTSPP